MRSSAGRGYSMVELLVVIGILALIGTLSYDAFVSLNAGKALDAGASQVLAELRQARSLALASKDGSAWGVHVASSSLTLFEGNAYAAGAASNITIAMNPSVSISIALAGGRTDVVFARLSGETDASGAITLSLASTPSRSRTVTIYETGLADAH